MYDVDRYVDRLYTPVLVELGIEVVKTEWHRYAVDLNRLADDIDRDSVQGDANASGKFPRGFHWSITTVGEALMPGPMPRATHDLIVLKYFTPFHHETRAALERLRARVAPVTYHIDLHSMPSVGTKEHRDPGEHRADVVISDCEGKSCSSEFKNLVIQAYAQSGFKVAYNWPYKGGRLTETYGKPAQGQHAIQVELNRALYMDETTKAPLNVEFAEIQTRVATALRYVHDSLPKTE